VTVANWRMACDFVWQKGYDDPADGYHVTPGDAGGGTFGGVIEAVWVGAVSRGLVTGTLRNATRDQLALVLKNEFWGTACDELPSGVDLMLFNGRMMSGGYPDIFQRCVGFTGAAVDGDIGPETIAAAKAIAASTLIEKLTVAHIYYLSGLGASWTEFHDGWEGRLLNAYTLTLSMADATPGQGVTA
jgi:lysozyme family protein